MAEGIRIELPGADEALLFLGTVSDQAQNPRGLFDNIGLSLVTSTQRRFEAGVSPDGSPWPPSLRVLAEGGKTLIKSSRLMNSITFEASDSGVSIGTNVIYAAVHQLGAIIVPVTAKALAFIIGGKKIFAKKVEIPARPFLGLDEDDEKEIEILAGEWLLGDQGE